MYLYLLKLTSFFSALFLTFSIQASDNKSLPHKMLQIMQEKKYAHSIWGMYVKDLQSGDVLFDLNAQKLFSPASTTKLFSVAALLHSYGDDYRFKTPIYATGKIEDGRLQGDLILVAQGDLTMGGREVNRDTIAYTKLDHINANEVPGVILTKENPLQGLNELAKQVRQSGIREIEGRVLIDISLFETIEKRGLILSPIMINENLIDIVINPTIVGQRAILTWRPVVANYEVKNQITTVAKDGPLNINISADETGHSIILHGTIPINQRNVVRTSPIKDPKTFAQAALIAALQEQGITIKPTNFDDNSRIKVNQKLSDYDSDNLKQVALWTSAPLSEYAKLILKVSHNLGANLVPLLLAARDDKKTFSDGMLLLGDFALKQVKLPKDTFVFGDAAGGNENRLTPQATVQLLEYLKMQKPLFFESFFKSLPILGVDGSLEDFAKKEAAAGNVRAKTGTGVGFNLATNNYFLITQALAGYVEGKNGHLYAFSIIVNNASMPTINDIFPIFEDLSQLSSVIYNYSKTTEVTPKPIDN